MLFIYKCGTTSLKVSLPFTTESLVLDANRFGSTIATEFGSLSKLTRLELSSNSFTGTVPSTFKNLDFETLRLNLNPGLSGPILDFVDSWSNLKYFSIRSCAFTGTIPSTISGLTRLTHLSMGPDISGMLPSDIVKLTKLQELDIQGLRVGGTFPTQIHKMSNLRKFWSVVLQSCSPFTLVSHKTYQKSDSSLTLQAFRVRSQSQLAL